MKIENILRVGLMVLFVFQSAFLTGSTYYVDSQKGNDNNSGRNARSAFASLSRIRTLGLAPGDTVVLMPGSYFRESLILEEVKGSPEKLVVITGTNALSGSGDKRAVIDAAGFQNGVELINCAHIKVEYLAITANGGGVNTTDGEIGHQVGVKVHTSRAGDFRNITLENLLVYDIFFNEPGFTRGEAEVRSANGTQSYGWGIWFINRTDGATLADITVRNTQVRNVAHTGIKFTSSSRGGIRNVEVLNNVVFESGGPGIQMGGLQNGLFAHNLVNYSGSNNDTRKWGRGSGLWTWNTTDVIIERNQFLNANGPGDSAGCHIDYHCNNIIIQYNLSANNYGGFIEILGNNHNCAYRYNVSINDGRRVRGKNGAFQEGKVFWLSGYVGNRPPVGPFNSYIYNNTIYVDESLDANFAVTHTARGVLVANNIFYIKGNSKTVLGDQNRPDDGKGSGVDELVFKNNLYLRANNLPADLIIQDADAILGDPRFQNPGGLNIEDYVPTNTSKIKNKGIFVEPLPNDSIGLFIGLEVKHDILGNEISGPPPMGAIAPR